MACVKEPQRSFPGTNTTALAAHPIAPRRVDRGREEFKQDSVFNQCKPSFNVNFWLVIPTVQGIKQGWEAENVRSTALTPTLLLVMHTTVKVYTKA